MVVAVVAGVAAELELLVGARFVAAVVGELVPADTLAVWLLVWLVPARATPMPAKARMLPKAVATRVRLAGWTRRLGWGAEGMEGPFTE